MLKLKFDWWFKNNSFLPNNHDAFRKGMGLVECLPTFINTMYHSFYNK